MNDIIVLLIIVLVLGIAILKIRSDRKKGIKCPGCSHSVPCESRGCSCHSEPHQHEDEKGSADPAEE